MNLKTYLIIAILSAMANMSYGQSERIYETIFCENQSILKGTILSEDDSLITIKLYNINDTLVLDKKLIKRVIGYRDNEIYSGGTYHKKHGFITSISFHAGEDIYVNTLTQLQVLRYKIINPKYGIGAGLGWSRVINSHVDDYGQLFLYGKYLLNNNKRRFFIDAKFGAALKIRDSVLSEEPEGRSSGAQIQTGFGIEMAKTSKQRLSFHGGFTFNFSDKFILGYLAGIGFNF